MSSTMKNQKIIGRQRLEKLAKLLYSVPAEKFCMGSWMSGNLNRCGSTACAIGWASTIFINDGLLLVRPEYHAVYRPAFKGVTNWRAVEMFFELPSREAQRLFGPNQEIGPRQVAKRIKQYLKTGRVAK